MREDIKLGNILRSTSKMMDLTNRDADFSLKADGSPVTRFDFLIAENIKYLAKIELGISRFICEEETFDPEELDKDNVLIIDPIDGTINFLTGIGDYAITAAVLKNREALFGAIYLPIQDRLITAYRGGGVFLNNQPFRLDNFPKSQVVSSSSYKTLKKSSYYKYWELFCKKNHFNNISTNSLAADLFFVAEGMQMARIKINAFPWDHAAGILIAQENGNICFDLKTCKKYELISKDFICGRKDLVMEFMELWKKNI